MTEEQANEIAQAVGWIAQDAAFGWGDVPESRARLVNALMSSSPTVGTPEYEPTEPGPARLSGGAN